MADQVLDRVVGGEELRGEVVLADPGVRSREGVFPPAEGADPDRRLVIDAGVGVEDGPAAAADQRVVRKRWEIVDLDEWGTHDAERDDQSRRF